MRPHQCMMILFALIGTMGLSSNAHAWHLKQKCPALSSAPLRSAPLRSVPLRSAAPLEAIPLCRMPQCATPKCEAPKCEMPKCETKCETKRTEVRPKPCCEKKCEFVLIPQHKSCLNFPEHVKPPCIVPLCPAPPAPPPHICNRLASSLSAAPGALGLSNRGSCREPKGAPLFSKTDSGGCTGCLPTCAIRRCFLTFPTKCLYCCAMVTRVSMRVSAFSAGCMTVSPDSAL